MTLIQFRWLATACCLAFLVCVPVSGCNDEVGSSGGTGGMAGMAGAAGAAGGGGMGGMGGMEPLPQLWEGQSNGVDVCFSISGDGLTLTTKPGCSLSADGGQGGQGEALSFDLDVRLAGTDQNAQPCSFELGNASDITIDQDTNSFRGSVIEPPGSGITLSFSGELAGQMASGVARRDEGASFCSVGWAASTSNQCDQGAIDACLNLQNCCRAILVNPVFFEACNSVVLKCDRKQCEKVLAGYSQCSPAP